MNVLPEMQASRPETPPDPDHLWIWEKNVYLDENRRSWLPIILKTEGKFQVIMRQENVDLGPSVNPRLLLGYELPIMWQLYPGKRYRGSDSVFWKILYHIKFRGTEDMLLENMNIDEDR